MATTYKHILKDGSKVQVDSAIRDGNGKKIDTNYSLKIDTVSAVVYDSSTKQLKITRGGSTTTLLTFGSNAFNSTSIPTSYIKPSNSSAQTIYSTSSNNPLKLRSNTTFSLLGFVNSGSSTLGYLGVNSSNKPIFRDTSNADHPLSYLVTTYTLSSAANSFTISGLDIVADGGVYDIFLHGSVPSHQWIKMSGVEISNPTTASGTSLYTERQDGAIGTLDEYGRGIRVTIYKPNSSDYALVFYSSMAYSSTSHHTVNGCAVYTGAGTSFTFTCNNGVNFGAGTYVKIYKRG